MQRDQKRHLEIFEFPANNNVSIVRKMTKLGLSDSCHQVLELDPQMDIFGPLEREIWQCEVSSVVLV